MFKITTQWMITYEETSRNTKYWKKTKNLISVDSKQAVMQTGVHPHTI
jgi:hypothetical protein